MCVMSAVIDHYGDQWKQFTTPIPPYPWPNQYPDPILNQGEREKLKKEIEDFRKILKKAKEWDAEHQTEPCTETADKIEALREVVRALGLEEEVGIVLKEVLEDADNQGAYSGTNRTVSIGGTAGGNVVYAPGVDVQGTDTAGGFTVSSTTGEVPDPASYE